MFLVKLTEVCQHRRDARHVLHHVVRDVAHPLGQGVQVDWLDNLWHKMVIKGSAGVRVFGCINYSYLI